MADEKEETKKSTAPKKESEKEFVVSKDAAVNFTVTVVSTDKDPYHKTGSEWHCGDKKAEDLEAAGWVTIKDKKK